LCGGSLRRVRVAGARKASRRAAVRRSAVLLVRPGGQLGAGRAEPGAGGPAPDLLHGLCRAPSRRGGAGWVRRVGPSGRAGRKGSGDAQLVSRSARRDGGHRRPDHLGLLADAMLRTVRFLQWAARARDPDALMAAQALLVSYASILMYGMLNYGLRQRHFWFVIALTVALPHVYMRWRA